jgi:hypothetical protein
VMSIALAWDHSRRHLCSFLPFSLSLCHSNCPPTARQSNVPVFF